MRKAVIVMVVVVIAMALAAGPIFANEAVSSENENNWQGKRAGNWMARVSEILNLKVEDLREQLRSGKTIVEVAEEEGLDGEELTNALTESQKAQIMEKVDQGVISEEKMEECLERMEQKTAERLNRTHMFRQRAENDNRPMQRRGKY